MSSRDFLHKIRTLVTRSISLKIWKVKLGHYTSMLQYNSKNPKFSQCLFNFLGGKIGFLGVKIGLTIESTFTFDLRASWLVDNLARWWKLDLRFLITFHGSRFRVSFQRRWLDFDPLISRQLNFSRVIVDNFEGLASFQSIPDEQLVGFGQVALKELTK